jgi:hypothetical protein
MVVDEVMRILEPYLADLSLHDRREVARQVAAADTSAEKLTELLDTDLERVQVASKALRTIADEQLPAEECRRIAREAIAAVKHV